jgi:hypothetical protein
VAIPRFEPQDLQRFDAAIRRFDEENSHDPNQETIAGVSQPRELVHARWLTEWVMKLCPEASEELRLAARCQHICRWLVPRDSYPMTRVGYLKWREGLKKFHADKAGEILAKVGYPAEVISIVQNLNLKKNFPQDPESRVLEDALCLVFLERQLEDLAQKTTDEKVINALKKSWIKMTPTAREIAKSLSYGPRATLLLTQALDQNPSGQQ